MKLGTAPIVMAVVAAAFGAVMVRAQQQTPSQQAYPFQNPNLPIEQRVNNIVSLMTLDEKIACLGTNPSVPRLGIRGTGHSEGLHGLALGGPGGWGRPVPIPTTQFAQEIGMGETWDPDLIRLAGGVEGYEARYINQSEKTHRGSLVIRAPNADLGRDPRWGRTEECFGEDPYFNGKMVGRHGQRTSGRRPEVLADRSLMKHFLANSNEDGRGGSSSDFDERLLREYYSVPFRMGVMEGGSRAYMASYNARNHIPMTVNPILRDITMKEWGVDGIICTDAGSLRNMVNPKLHNYYKTYAEGAAGAVKAGINQFLEPTLYRHAVQEALKKNLLTENDIDDVIKGEFRVMIRLGLLDPPAMVQYARSRARKRCGGVPEHKEIARQVAQESIVLLKNADNFLPLKKAALKSIAVLGPLADVVAAGLVQRHSGLHHHSARGHSRTRLGGAIAVNLCRERRHGSGRQGRAGIRRGGGLRRQSSHLRRRLGEVPHAERRQGSHRPQGHQPGAGGIRQADLRRESENRGGAAGQFSDRHQLEPGERPGHPAHHPQRAGGGHRHRRRAVRRHQSRRRLVQTWPKSLDQVPPMMDYNIRHGRTYMYFKGEPLYPFGYGLSYTTFKYSNLKLSAARLGKNGADHGQRGRQEYRRRGKGDEVVQLYVTHLNSKVERARQGAERLPAHHPPAERNQDRHPAREGGGSGLLG